MSFCSRLNSNYNLREGETANYNTNNITVFNLVVFVQTVTRLSSDLQSQNCQLTDTKYWLSFAACYAAIKRLC